jgi:hypothetical protein
MKNDRDGSSRYEWPGFEATVSNWALMSARSPRNGAAGTTTAVFDWATTGTTATTELGSDVCVPSACGVNWSTLANVLGQRMTTVSSTRAKRMMRAGATYGSPAAGPKPPSPVQGTDVSMKSWSNCVVAMTR